MEIVKSLVSDTELNKEYNITIPLPVLDLSIDERAEEKRKNYRLDGFRIGKVPVEEIKKREKINLFYSAVDKIIGDTINNIIKDNNYKLASQAKIDFKQFEADKEVILTVNFELMPKVPEIRLDKIGVDYYKVNITDEDVQKSVDRILSSYKNWVPKDAPAENGDTVKINFVGYVNGIEFRGNRGENFNLLLGSNTFISGFEEQLIGAKNGDKIKVQTKFPDYYHASDLAGKDVVFDVEILEVLKTTEMELTDEFVKKTFGIDNVETFKENVKIELSNTYNEMSKSKVKNVIMDKLNEVVDFNLPETAVQNRIEALKKYKQENNAIKDLSEDIDGKELEKEARKTMKCGYIFADIAEKNNIIVNDGDLTEAIMREAQNMVGNEKGVIDFYRNNQQALETLKIRILENKVVDFIIDNVTKNEISISTDEFNKL